MKTIEKMKGEVKEVYLEEHQQQLLLEEKRYETLNQEKKENDEKIDEEISYIEEKRQELREGLFEYNQVKKAYEEAKLRFEAKQEERENLQQSIKESEESVHALKVKQRKIDEEQIRIEKLFEEEEKKKEKQTKGIRPLTHALQSNPGYIGLELKQQLMEAFTYCKEQEVQDSFSLSGDFLLYEYLYLEDIRFVFVTPIDPADNSIDVYVKEKGNSTLVAENVFDKKRNYFVALNQKGEALTQEKSEEINELVTDVIRYLKTKTR